MIVSEVSYHPVTAKLERVDIVFKRKSHTGQISQIQKYHNDDIVLTGAHDGSIIFWDVEREQKLMHLTEHDEAIQAIQFMDDFSFMCSSTRNDLIVWQISCDERDGGKGERRDPSDTRYVLRAKVFHSIDIEEKGSFMSSKIFGTNLRYDYLLFVSVGSDIKIMNILKGKYIGDIDGAHFKGTTNFGLILNAGGNSRIKGTLARINQVLTAGNQKDLLNLFVDQLNDYLIVSTSSKDKLRAWKFDDAFSSPISQINALGGCLDSQIFIFSTRSGETALVLCGSCSNKIEVFTLS